GSPPCCTRLMRESPATFSSKAEAPISSLRMAPESLKLSVWSKSLARRYCLTSPGVSVTWSSSSRAVSCSCRLVRASGVPPALNTAEFAPSRPVYDARGRGVASPGGAPARGAGTGPVARGAYPRRGMTWSAKRRIELRTRSCGICPPGRVLNRSEEHTSELQSRGHLVCRLLLEKKKEHPEDIPPIPAPPR